MLDDASVTAMLPVVDLRRARAFYEKVLGLRPVQERADGKVFYESGGGRFALYERATPTTADHTALSFELADVRQAVAALRERGVRFEEYDFPGLKTTDGVCVLGAEIAAWFKDPDGNILCVHELR
ncbi:MAG: VOC family protein [Acidobacteria bacterium]|nr:VOC family protein [Acidobacteriota bacterium]